MEGYFDVCAVYVCPIILAGYINTGIQGYPVVTFCVYYWRFIES